MYKSYIIHITETCEWVDIGQPTSDSQPTSITSGRMWSTSHDFSGASSHHRCPKFPLVGDQHDDSVNYGWNDSVYTKIL